MICPDGIAPRSAACKDALDEGPPVKKGAVSKRTVTSWIVENDCTRLDLRLQNRPQFASLASVYAFWAWQV